jgi:hypothetical protein
VNPAVVARYSTIGEAQSARSALDAAGVDVDVGDENIVSVNWLYSNAVGGVKLIVRRDDLERAFEVLSTPSKEPAADDEVTESRPPQSDDQPVICPACGNTKLARIPRLKILAALALVVFGVGVAISQPGLTLALMVSLALIVSFVPSHRCTSCGEKWNARESPEPERDAPPPSASDMTERRCRRCGSSDVFRIHYWRLQAIPLWFTLAIVVVVPIWSLLPKRRCDQCGLRTYF